MPGGTQRHAERTELALTVVEIVKESDNRVQKYSGTYNHKGKRG